MFIGGRMMTEEKNALVLGGGGSRGAYEIGVWQALNELDIPIHIVTGSSVGAINGALIAQGTFDLAMSLWKDLDTSAVFDVELKEIFQNSGLGISGLRDLLATYISEEDVRKSAIEYGLVTAELPLMVPKYLIKSQIPAGKLHDYILASSTLFPVSKSYEIDKLKYADGGFSDNLPVSLALEQGATNVITVDLGAMGIIKKTNGETPGQMTSIQCTWDLGNILKFDQAHSKHILRLGYLDAMKAFDVFDGTDYCFVKNEFDKRRMKSANLAGKIFELNPEIIYKKSLFHQRLKEAIDLHREKAELESASYGDSLLDKIADQITKAKSLFSEKTLTLIIAKSLAEKDDSRNPFLSAPAMRFFKEEIYAANYLIREKLI